jgi:hypothetical protein
VIDALFFSRPVHTLKAVGILSMIISSVVMQIPPNLFIENTCLQTLSQKLRNFRVFSRNDDSAVSEPVFADSTYVPSDADELKDSEVGYRNSFTKTLSFTGLGS